MCPNGNADLTRSLIINSAIQIISQDGLSALTAGRLIDQAGISKGGLYHHFRTMQEVEVEVLERLLQSITLSISAYPAPETAVEFLNLVEKEIFSHFVADNEYARALYAYISEAANNSTVKVLLRTLNDDLTLHRRQQLTAICPAFAPATLGNVVQIIATMQLGLMSRYFITDDITSLKSYWRGCRGVLADLLHIEEVLAPDDLIENIEARVRQVGVS
jgi:AcrR family transcriptional regulator